jgi:hypothetical protein
VLAYGDLIDVRLARGTISALVREKRAETPPGSGT